MTMTDIQLLLILPFIAAGAMVVSRRLKTTTVFEYERGLKFVRGHLRNELGPGRYRHLSSTTLRKVDVRETLLAVNTQEVLSKDGVAVKASLSASYRIVDVRAAVLGVTDYASALYTELQQALRIAVSSADVEAMLANRADLGEQILRDVRLGAGRIGLDVERVAVRDLTLPGELKKIFAQTVKARQEGLAALERVRGETAALRNLANAAQMVERHPQLLQLRLLQLAGQQTALTMVVGMPPGTTPIPIGGAIEGEGQ
jgi:regulator of protease activity HflC (stomatin/prohibitin superfamily)